MKTVIKFLNLAEDAPETDVYNSVRAITEERDALKKEKEEREQALRAEQKTKAETLVDAAIRDGRVNDDEKHGARTSWLKFFEVNFEAAEKSLGTVTVPKPVHGQLQQGAAGDAARKSAWTLRQEEIEKNSKK